MELNFQTLKDYSEKVGDSYYIFDRKSLIADFTSLIECFKAYFDDTKIAYSYKTNYVPAICEQVDQMGGYAEVVSDMEFQIAKNIGVASDQIFYNGPVKTGSTISAVCTGGGIVNLDSIADLELLEQVANKDPSTVFNVGVRCNFDIGDGVVSRFGFDTHDADFHRCLTWIETIKNVQLKGLTCHFASRSLQAWQNATEGMIRVLQECEELGIYIRVFSFISLGGGLFGPMEPDLKNQLDPSAPSFEEYAKVAARPFNDFVESRQGFKPTLFLEPGTAVVANSIKYVCKVQGIKRVGEKFIAHVSGSSFNTSGSAGGVNLPIRVFSSESDEECFEFFDIAGYTCVEKDYLYKNYQGHLAVGDFLLFDSVGSYSIVMKPPFIFPNVAIIEPSDGDFKVIKRAECFDDVFQTYTFRKKLI